MQLLLIFIILETITDVKYEISHYNDMILLNQLSPIKRENGCWIYAATMMYSWKHKASFQVETVAKNASNASKSKINYEMILQSNEGLPLVYEQDFTSSMNWIGLKYSPTGDGIYQLLKTKGPLFFFHTPNPNDLNKNLHALVIIGLTSDNLNKNESTYLEYFDPWEGKHGRMTFEDYVIKYIKSPYPFNSYLYHN